VAGFGHCNVATPKSVPRTESDPVKRRRSEDRTGEDHQGGALFPSRQLQLWAWKNTLDLGYELQGSLNLSPPITEKTRFTK
jgi:peptide/nickel transport system substrate-binding protein